MESHSAVFGAPLKRTTYKMIHSMTAVTPLPGAGGELAKITPNIIMADISTAPVIMLSASNGRANGSISEAMEDASRLVRVFSEGQYISVENVIESPAMRSMTPYMAKVETVYIVIMNEPAKSFPAKTSLGSRGRELYTYAASS